jgi:hypothetical protein
VSITSPRSPQIALVFITPGSQIIASASAWETSRLAAEVRLMRPKAVMTLIKMVGFMLIFFEESLREEKKVKSDFSLLESCDCVLIVLDDDD